MSDEEKMSAAWADIYRLFDDVITAFNKKLASPNERSVLLATASNSGQ
jgi:hypothetical protein